MTQMPEAIERFLKNTGSKGVRTLSFLGKHQPLVTAFETDVGKEILKYGVDRHEYLVQRVLNNEATDDEKAERKALFSILEKWSQLINSYYEALNFVKVHE
jgi:hypothetical protein